MKEEILIYFIGTAGSGKSTFTQSFKKWMDVNGLDSIIVNLDPGADNLPYEPDVDVRDWISLEEIMDSYNLGPNGAQIACADLVALNIAEIKETIESFKTDYVLVDTPGQLELFVFRESARQIIKFLNPTKTMIAYLIDHALAKTASSFVSQNLLSLNTNFRLQQPHVNLLSKTDMLSDEEIKQVEKWSEDIYDLEQSLYQEEASMHRELNEEIIKMMNNLGNQIPTFFVGKGELYQLEDFYTTIQMQFHGGEDLMKD
jgi:GPN-loop GTPase